MRDLIWQENKWYLKALYKINSILESIHLVLKYNHIWKEMYSNIMKQFSIENEDKQHSQLKRKMQVDRM